MANANDKPKILGAPPRPKPHQTRPNERADAFTFPVQTKVGGTQFRTLGGLTKREYFASLAMQGLTVADRLARPGERAARAVELADALIDALNADPAEEGAEA